MADKLRLYAVAYERTRTLALLQNEGLAATAVALERLEPNLFAAVFHHPLFFAVRMLGETTAAARRRVLVALPRFLFGTPVAEGFRWDVPPELLDAPLYLPHLHAQIATGTALTLRQQGGILEVLRGEHVAATLPAGGDWLALAQSAPGSFAAAGIEPLPRLAAWQMMNLVVELRGAPWSFETGAPDLRAGAALALGFELLERVWPAAAADCRRFYQAALHLPSPDDRTLSFTNASFLGAFAATWRDPVQVADALSHEVAHTRLAPFFDIGGLIEGDDPAVHPSPWRKDLRPLRGLVNGVHAFLNVCRFYHLLRLAEPELVASTYPDAFERHRTGILSAWPYTREHARWTEAGVVLAGEIDEAVADLEGMRGLFG